MDQEEINQLIRAWVVLFLGDNANPVLYGGDVLSRVDTARAERTAGMNTERTQTQKGQGGRGMNATVLPITYIPIGEPHRSPEGVVRQSMETEYSVQFFWRGEWDKTESGALLKHQAQSTAVSFAVWTKTSQAREFLQSHSIAMRYVSEIADLTELSVTEAERQDRAGVTLRIGYDQGHDFRPTEIAGIAPEPGFVQADIYDLTFEGIELED